MAPKDIPSPEEKTNVLFGEEEVVHNINIGNMILDAFKSKPDFIGQIDAATREETTFRQMQENSVKCALWLQKLRYKNIVISICTSCNQMLAYIPYLACLYTGITINPWDASYFEDDIRLMYFLAEYEPKIIFIDGNNYKTLIRVIRSLVNQGGITPSKIITFDRVEGVDSLESILNADVDGAKIDTFSCDETDPMTIMAEMFSSNAISYPGKANVRYFALAFPSNQEIPAMSPGDVGLWYGSLVWTHSLILTVRSIISYVTVIKSSNFTAEDMYETIEKYKVKWVFLESKMGRQLFQTDVRMYDISSLKQLIFGDSTIEQSTYENLIEYFTNVSIIQVYSIPDSGIIATYQRDNDPIASGGYLAKNIQLMILNIQKKKALGPNALGEIWYKYTCKWCDAETCQSLFCCNNRVNKNKTKNKNKAKQFDSAAITSTWHCTGDYGYYEKDGKLIIIDNINRLIKYKEFHISPLRIEKVLQCHPAVAEVTVLPVPDINNGQHPRAFIEIKHGAKVTAEDLNQLVEEHLPDIYKLRGGVYVTTLMPHLPNGKIDRMLVQRRSLSTL